MHSFPSRTCLHWVGIVQLPQCQDHSGYDKLQGASVWRHIQKLESLLILLPVYRINIIEKYLQVSHSGSGFKSHLLSKLHPAVLFCFYLERVAKNCPLQVLADKLWASKTLTWERARNLDWVMKENPVNQSYKCTADEIAFLALL